MTLPTVLIGPILRRVEPRHVSVYVATSAAAEVTTRLYDGDVDANSPPATALGSAQAATRAFGAKFHAVVVTVELADAAALQPGHLYSYDVELGIEGASHTLASLGLLEDRTGKGYGNAAPANGPVEISSLGYQEHHLPSFVTCPAQVGELVLAHASCRKPHGNGDPGLQYLDQFIDDLHRDPGAQPVERPQMLFLTGDQIYADDVAAALLPALTELGRELLGGVEEMPLPAGAGAAKVDQATLPAGFRQRLTTAAGFTSEEASSHLLGFGEYLAMYCAAWNPDVWESLPLAKARIDDTAVPAKLREELEADAGKSGSTASTIGAPDPPAVLARPSSSAPLTPLYGDNAPRNEEQQKAFDAARLEVLGEFGKSFLADKASLDDFRREVPKARRLLANTPTYMICDDHEVTDDWFMTGGIRSKCLGNPFGKALVRNALAAYVVCQGWGNDPAAWSEEEGKAGLLAATERLFGASFDGGPADSGADRDFGNVLGLTPGAQPTLDFSFSVDGPMHRVRVLDTRTRRQYDTTASPPGLLTRDALDHQLPATDALPEGHVLVVVSPAPVFGPVAMTEIGMPVAASALDVVTIAASETKRAAAEAVTGFPGGRPPGYEIFDAEDWGHHAEAYERLLARLAKQPRVVVLAGDVHYGAAYAMDWTAPAGTSEPRTSRIVHFTSSAARNAWVGIVRNLFALNSMSAGLQRIGLPTLRVGWTATLPPVVDDLDLEPATTRWRVQLAPVVLSDPMFRSRHALHRPPEWAWRADAITDRRAPSERPAAARAPALEPDLPESGAIDRYPEAAATHVRGLDTAAVSRGLQFLCNSGLVKFAAGSDGGMHVSQTLFSLRARHEPNEQAADYVVHEALLDPQPIPIPTAVGPEP